TLGCPNIANTFGPFHLINSEHLPAELCSQITLIFRDYGSREARNKCRLAFLIDDWGVDKFREELEKRMGHPLSSAGNDLPLNTRTDHAGVFPQKQPGLNYVGLVVPVGRITSDQLVEIARLAEVYGDGQIRLTPGQNVIIPNVPDQKLESLKAEPLLAVLNPNASEVMRGLVSCTGIDYCHFALIDTKELAIKTARILEQTLGRTEPLTIHWSGCPNACGNHTVSDIGLLGKRTRVDGKIIDAVDIFLGEKFAGAKGSPEALENVPCDELPQVLERLISAPVALTT
ncbi:MAG: ferredoxin--nitrite reductase, partial [Chloroflexi bacterium]|nr:ferredoxin--nitrite reductase [Chloroflexota bacterium]